MLSERDAQVLRSIEEHLAADDPAFAARMARKQSGVRSRGLDLLYVQAAITLALLLAMVFLVNAALGSTLIAVALACLLFRLRRASRRRLQD